VEDQFRLKRTCRWTGKKIRFSGRLPRNGATRLQVCPCHLFLLLLGTDPLTRTRKLFFLARRQPSMRRAIPLASHLCKALGLGSAILQPSRPTRSSLLYCTESWVAVTLTLFAHALLFSFVTIAFAPMFVAPLSETLGRRPIFICSVSL
jgi:hypothetical protein